MATCKMTDWKEDYESEGGVALDVSTESATTETSEEQETLEEVTAPPPWGNYY